MQLLDEALGRLKPTLVDKIERGDFGDSEYRYSGDSDYNYFGHEDTTADSIARLRLDWEISNEAELTPQSIADSMLAQVGVDLEDLIVNGDVHNVGDPLLKVIDGSEKRGKKPVSIDIFSALLYRQYISRKNSFEYTWYMLMAIDWEK